MELTSGDWSVEYPYPHPVAMYPPWATGRFYDCSAFNNTGATTTSTPASASLFAIPVWVPQPIAITNMGIEVTGAGSGSSGRFAVYDTAQLWEPINQQWVPQQYPHQLVCQTASTALNSAAYINAAAGFTAGYGGKLPQGLVWVTYVQVATTTSPTVRALGAAASPYLAAANNAGDVGSRATNILIGGWTATMITNGMPLRFPNLVAGQNPALQAATVPRVILET